MLQQLKPLHDLPLLVRKRLIETIPFTNPRKRPINHKRQRIRLLGSAKIDKPEARRVQRTLLVWARERAGLDEDVPCEGRVVDEILGMEVVEECMNFVSVQFVVSGFVRIFGCCGV